MLKIPGYTITSKIYEGTKTVVYRGYRHHDEQPVIVKSLWQEYPALTEIAKLKHQYEIAYNLPIPGIVKPLELEKYNQYWFLILEDFGGDSLQNFLLKNKINLKRNIQIVINVSETISQLHQNNIIHKDIKPQNILINPETGLVKITDFSIASRLSRENQMIGNPNLLEGTLAYISPEQTGRMNRSIDYRTDFYSLGVTFYEMLTGRVPFQSNDPMELVHCHIASLPIPPNHLNPNIPPAVSDIVMKLLSKNAEDRYQSAFGLKADLETCLTHLESTGKISDFPLGRHDISDKFQIPQKLYGRDSEIASLMAAFERVSLGSTEMMLVSGFSGIGKSALVNEIHKPIVRQRGYFISGKFDQFKRNIPYASLIQAFQELVRQLLTETQEKIDFWKTQLLESLGCNGQVIIDVIPEVELIIGKQPPVPELAPTEAQNRLNLVFQKFLSVFTTKDHPLVLFLDDLQWADSASLKLIYLLMTDPDSKYLLMIGAYRNNEVSATHPLMLTLDELKKSDIAVNNISLNSLVINNVNSLIADTFKSESTKTNSLAKLVFNKTNGNPFFLTQFLKSLYEENLFNFNLKQGCWQWDLKKIRGMQITDNVVELMVIKVKKLSESTQKSLKLAACIGNEFNLKVLSIVNEKSQVETSVELREALKEGLILPIGNAYKYVQDYTEDTLNVSLNNDLAVAYKFLHDRVQQAVYSLIPETDKQQVHLKVGQLLLKNTDREELEDKIFDIVNQLNCGKDIITNQEAKYELANLNLTAGKKAKLSTAFEPALKYITAGMELLCEKDWEFQYPLILSLYKERAECEYLNGNIDECEKFFEIILNKAASNLEKASVYIMKIIIYTTNLMKTKEAIEIGKAGLRLFGISLPDGEKELRKLIESETQKVKANLAGREVKDLIDAPDMTDLEKVAATKILINMTPPARFIGKHIFDSIMLKMVNISLKYGNSNVTSFAYMSYGWTLAGRDEFESAYQYGELALKVNEKFNNLTFKCKLNMIFGSYISHWKNHLRTECEGYLKNGFQDGIEIGDFQWATYSAYYRSVKLTFKGDNLDEVYQEAQKCLEFTSKKKIRSFIDMFLVIQKFVLSLKGETEQKTSFNDNNFKEEEHWDELKKVPALYVTYCILKAQLLYLYEEYDDAMKAIAEGETLISIPFATIMIPEHYFYSTLIQTALYPTLLEVEKEQAMQNLLINLEKMRKWSEACPDNFLHKYLLMSAEIARITGKEGEALDLYEKSINSARENDYIQNEAIANELAAKFFFGKGYTVLAKAHILEAHYGYLKWGAIAKVNDVEEKYPQFFSGVSVTGKAGSLSNIISSSTGSDSGLLDVTTVVKASQTLASEIVLDKLLEKLMKIVIENAGAQKGFLILEESGNLAIAAEGEVDRAEVTVLQFIPVESSHKVSPAIVNYVKRTKNNLVLNDATNQGLFKSDSYVLQYQPKSILCLPIIKQTHLIGLLYLENNLTTNAFTPDRLKVLEMLSSQIAISLENAKLYDEMTALNADLKQEIDERKQAENRLRESEERFRLIAETTPVPLLISRVSDSQILYANMACSSTLGLSTQELIGRQAQEFHYDPEARKELLKILAKNGYVRNYEFQAKKVDGTPFWINLSIQPIAFNGEQAMLSGFQDITERKRMEELKDEFLANTSHELRTPLNGIIGITESLIDGVTGHLPEKTIYNLSMVVSSAHRLSNLINDILDFSKLKHGNLPLKIKPVGMREITNVVLTLSQPLIGKKSLQLINKIAPNTPSVNADEDRVQQILYNLVGNAIKFTDSGVVEVSASVVEEEQKEDSSNAEYLPYLAITVADTGIGIPPEKFGKIFESFEQADGSTARIYGGTGLGLAITKKLVELHNGEICVKSQMGVGSQFTFTLPLSKEVKVEELKVEERFKFKELKPRLGNLQPAKQQFATQSGDVKILIVDDEPVNVQVLVNYLSEQNYSLTQAFNGIEALAAIAQGLRPDIILLDVMMPRMTGYEVCKKIREQYSLNELPILMLTAKNQVSDLVEGFKSGANDYLIKPISKNELLARINLHLQLSNLEALRQAEAREREKAQQLELTLSALQRTQAQLIQAEKMSSIGQLVAGVAHEINNPVNFIYGNLAPTNDYARDLLNLIQMYEQFYPDPVPEIQREIETIELEYLKEDFPKILSSMQVGAERIQSIVLSLRNFSRLDEAEMKPVDIHSGIESTLLILQHRLKPQKNRLGIEVVKEFARLPKVACYAGQLNQVFMNILSNAIDALEEVCGLSFAGHDHEQSTMNHEQSPTIWIRTSVVEEDRVAIRIGNNGPSMTEEVQKKIFDPFFTTKPVGAGTGLGLSISYSIVVERHGGQIRCISSPLQGVEFIIEIPIQQQKKG
ncbi:AAA family ATPase [Trichocoleus sp. Lan]|uniref:ATP-binding protein n=1 Tax=Trichocoleus sp. Lan TaxID=2933927 RepID=UPI00329A68A4